MDRNQNNAPSTSAVSKFAASFTDEMIAEARILVCLKGVNIDRDRMQEAITAVLMEGRG